MDELKLYVWGNVFCDYTCGIAFAIAHDSEEARKMIIEKAGYIDTDLANPPDVYKLNNPIAFYVAGGG